jgi:hypothetical protein
VATDAQISAAWHILVAYGKASLIQGISGCLRHHATAPVEEGFNFDIIVPMAA